MYIQSPSYFASALVVQFFLPFSLSQGKVPFPTESCSVCPTKMPSRSSPVYETEGMAMRDQDVESGYASGSSSEASIPEVFFTKPHLTFLNRQLQNLEPQGMSYATTILFGSSANLQSCRNFTMVHHNPSLALPNYRVRSYWSCDPRYAL